MNARDEADNCKPRYIFDTTPVGLAFDELQDRLNSSRRPVVARIVEWETPGMDGYIDVRDQGSLNKQDFILIRKANM